MRTAGRAAAGLMALLSLAALPGCGTVFFHPSREFVENPHLERALDGITREDVFFPTPDGLRLHGWMLRPVEKPLGTILFLHGNTGNVSTHAGAVLWLALAGYEVFLLDYRGFGLSEGKPGIEEIHVDALAALRAVAAIASAGDRIVVLGQSLGGSAAVYAVANSRLGDRVRALVIDSAFSGYRRIVREKMAPYLLLWPLRYPLSLLIDDRFSASRWAGRVSPVPLLIIHGTADAVVPESHGKRLFRLAQEPKRLWVIPGAGHIRAFADASVRDRLLAWLSSVLEDRPPGQDAADRRGERPCDRPDRRPDTPADSGTAPGSDEEA